jgi:hypothetical protein
MSVSNEQFYYFGGVHASDTIHYTIGLKHCARTASMCIYMHICYEYVGMTAQVCVHFSSR